MIRMFPRRRSQILINAGVDKVLFGISLPSECRLNNLHATVHVLGVGVHPVTVATMYAIEGYILPVLDPDAGVDLDDIWDALVPKDNDTDTIDLDTQALDTTSMFEPGESAMTEIMDVGLQPERIYATQRMNTFANAGFRQEETSVLEWSVANVHRIKLGKRYYVKQPSVVLFALGNADTLDTDVTARTALAENEWARVKYIELVLQQALMQHFGLVEAGAETPWVEAAQLLRKYIEPDVFEQSGGAFASETLRAYANVTMDVSVPGQMGKIQIGTGG